MNEELKSYEKYFYSATYTMYLLIDNFWVCFWNELRKPKNWSRAMEKRYQFWSELRANQILYV